MSSNWEPAEQVAKNDKGQFVAFIGGQWTPVASAAKDASGKFMVFRGIEDLKQAGVTKSAPPQMVPSGEKGLPNSMADYAAHPDLLAADPSARFAMGAAAPFLGLAQLAANAVGKGEGINAHLKQLEDMKRSGREKIGSEGFDWTEGAGTVLSPAWRALPASKPGATLLSKTGTAAVQGAAAGASSPVTDGGQDYWEQKGMQAGVGTALGLATPATVATAVKGGKMAYHGFVEPAFEAGQRAIKGRAYAEAAGNKADEIIARLTENKQLTPGSAPTAGEAASPAGRAEFSALQQSASRVKPSEYLSRSDEQNQARVAAVESFAGTPAKRAEATAAREARTEPHYAAGTSATATDLTGLKDLMERPSMAAVTKRTQQLMEERGGTFEPLKKNGLFRSMTGEEAQAMKLAFDDLIKARPASAMDTAEVQALRETRGEYIKWMEGAFPDLGTGRKLYKMTSGPVNQMDVGRELSDKLTPALREDAKLRSGSFASAVRDSASTIKKATGEPRFQQLEDVLTGRQLNKVHGVQEDLARSDRNLDMARRGAGAGPNAVDLATSNLEREVGGKMPNMLNRGVMLANAILARLEGKINRKLAGEMAMEMLDPPKVGEALAAAKAREMRNKLMAEQIARAHRPVIAAGAALAGHQGE